MAEREFTALDVDGNGEIDKHEWVSCFMKMLGHFSDTEFFNSVAHLAKAGAAAAKQRKAMAAAASTAADTTASADADADAAAAVAEVAAFEAAERARMAATPPPAAVSALPGGNSAGVGPRPSGGTPGSSCGGPGCAPAAASSAGSSGDGTSIGGPRILRPASMDDAKARQRAVASQLKSRLEKGGMSQAEVADTMAQFKSASTAFISAPMSSRGSNMSYESTGSSFDRRQPGFFHTLMAFLHTFS